MPQKDHARRYPAQPIQVPLATDYRAFVTRHVMQLQHGLTLDSVWPVLGLQLLTESLEAAFPRRMVRQRKPGELRSPWYRLATGAVVCSNPTKSPRNSKW